MWSDTGWLSSGPAAERAGHVRRVEAVRLRTNRPSRVTRPLLLLVALLSVMSLAVPMAPAHAANTDPAAYLVGHRWPTGHPSASGPAVGYPMKHQVTPPPEVAVWRPARLIAPVTGKPDTAAVYASDPPAADGGDIPPWVLAVGVIAAVGAAAIWAVRRRP